MMFIPLLLAAVFPVVSSIVQYGGTLQLGSVVPLTGEFSAWSTAADGLRAYAALMNEQNLREGFHVNVLAPGFLNTITLAMRLNVTVLDDASDRATHLVATQRLVTGAPRYDLQPGALTTQSPNYTNALLGRRPGVSMHAVIGVHPAFAREEAYVTTNLAGVLNLPCCTAAKTLHLVDYGQNNQLLYGVQADVGDAVEPVIRSWAQRGVTSMAIIFARNDPLTATACIAAAGHADTHGIGVGQFRAYDYGRAPLDSAVRWSWSSGLFETAMPYEWDVGAQLEPSATNDGVIMSLAEELVRLRITSLFLCGFHNDTAAIVRRITVELEWFLQALFVYPVGASSLAELEAAAVTANPATSGYSANNGLVLPLPAVSAFPSPSQPAADPEASLYWPQALGRIPAAYTSSLLPWHPDVRYNAPMVVDTPSFTAKYTEMTGTVPTWQAVSAASSASLLVTAIQSAFSQCVVWRPDIQPMLFDPNSAINCTDGLNHGIKRVLRVLDRGTTFNTLLGPVSYQPGAPHHMNRLHKPVHVQLQSEDRADTADASPLRRSIVFPVSQARTAGAGATVNSRDSVLPYPAPRGLVLPIPGTVYVRFVSTAGQFLFAVCLVSVLAWLAVASVTVVMRNKPSLRKTKISAALMILFGVLLTFFFPLAFLDRPSRLSCGARYWLLTTPLSLFIGVFFGKLYHRLRQYSYGGPPLSIQLRSAWSWRKSQKEVRSSNAAHATPAWQLRLAWKYKRRHGWYWPLSFLALNTACMLVWEFAGGSVPRRAQCVWGSPHAELLWWVLPIATLCCGAAATLYMAWKGKYLPSRYGEGGVMLTLATHHASLAVILIPVAVYLTYGSAATNSAALVAAGGTLSTAQAALVRLNSDVSIDADTGLTPHANAVLQAVFLVYVGWVTLLVYFRAKAAAIWDMNSARGREELEGKERSLNKRNIEKRLAWEQAILNALSAAALVGEDKGQLSPEEAAAKAAQVAAAARLDSESDPLQTGSSTPDNIFTRGLSADNPASAYLAAITDQLKTSVLGKPAGSLPGPGGAGAGAGAGAAGKAGKGKGKANEPAGETSLSVQLFASKTQLHKAEEENAHLRGVLALLRSELELLKEQAVEEGLVDTIAGGMTAAKFDQVAGAHAAAAMEAGEGGMSVTAPRGLGLVPGGRPASPARRASVVGSALQAARRASVIKASGLSPEYVASLNVKGLEAPPPASHQQQPHHSPQHQHHQHHQHQHSGEPSLLGMTAAATSGKPARRRSVFEQGTLLESAARSAGAEAGAGEVKSPAASATSWLGGAMRRMFGSPEAAEAAVSAGKPVREMSGAGLVAHVPLEADGDPAYTKLATAAESRLAHLRGGKAPADDVTGLSGVVSHALTAAAEGHALGGGSGGGSGGDGGQAARDPAWHSPVVSTAELSAALSADAAAEPSQQQQEHTAADGSRGISNGLALGVGLDLASVGLQPEVVAVAALAPRGAGKAWRPVVGNTPTRPTGKDSSSLFYGPTLAKATADAAAAVVDGPSPVARALQAGAAAAATSNSVQSPAPRTPRPAPAATAAAAATTPLLHSPLPNTPIPAGNDVELQDVSALEGFGALGPGDAGGGGSMSLQSPPRPAAHAHRSGILSPSIMSSSISSSGGATGALSPMPASRTPVSVAMVAGQQVAYRSVPRAALAAAAAFDIASPPQFNRPPTQPPPKE